jgi:predicted nuclease of predicted toxin-antitoxin system
VSIRFQADADLNFDIVKAVRQEEPAIDFASAADSQLRGIKDPELLELAAVANRVLVSHDRRTMLDHFRTRLVAGGSSPGVLIVSQGASIGLVAEAIVYIWSLSSPSELRNQAHYLPSISRHVFAR